MPTEADWECACRAGTTTEFHYGPDLFCNQARFWYSFHSSSSCGLNSASGTAPVGSYAPNAFGLCDMHGNVWEWCLHSPASYGWAPMTDPFVTGSPYPYRITRGGSWYADSHYCRSADRYEFDLAYPQDYVGFCVVLAPVLVR